jgi:tripartite-type tricarboxylate transporter receptor subunit TctC
MMNRRSILIVTSIFLGSSLGNESAAAQALGEIYPTRPVTIVTGIGIGGGPDVILRVVAGALGERWNKQVIVLNRPGANSSLAVQAVANSVPDGYTLLMAQGGIFYSLPETNPHIRADVRRDFVPIGMIAEEPELLAAHPQLGVNSLAELIALARHRPGQINYGAGLGSLPHITGERLKQRAGIELTFVPYPATAGAIRDSLNGTLPFVIESQAALSASISAGSLKPLAVASLQRASAYPDLPTVTEAAPELGNFVATGWFTLVAPSGTPDGIVQKIGHDLRIVLEDRQVRDRFAALGVRPRPMSQEEVSRFIDEQEQLLRPIVRQLGIAQK